ncbi:MAG: TorD/DmsD family molecular chaperone [Planctomycetota bacterium]
MFTDIASPDESALVALGQGTVYAHLAQGFAFPRQPLMDLVREQMEPSDGPVGATLSSLREEARRAGLQQLRRGYMRVFDPKEPPFPLEAEHTCENFRQKVLLLSDLMGFYRAFGAEVRCQRPDHVASELDFLYLLSLKEALARRDGDDQKVETTREARDKFLREHLLRWYPAVLGQVRDRATEPQDAFFRALADALETVLQQEGEHES